MGPEVDRSPGSRRPDANDRILAIVPAYNESGNIGRTVRELQAVPLPLDILVVDDGSRDATLREAREAGVLTVALPFNLGIGGAVQTGFQFAARKKYRAAVQVDGDGQHDARFLPDLLRPIESGEADMVIGSRFLPPYVGYRSSFIRRIGIQFFAWLIGALTGYRVTDPTSGFRAFNRRMIKTFAGRYPQDYPEPESIVLASRMSAQVKEVPVQMRERLSGHSSIRYLATLYYMFKVTLAILLDMVKVNKTGE
ncbi:MAG: glycosyltransferase family 2 protein [Candidatus Omnitrophota bacterium]|nr:glycosyltransferase family 2 protein [Candidatus Omnitrophota bacterium]MDZ4242725.1 glycosyltransferase family 2 protein [Candidatus Omnitrophota bacterium]